MFVFVCVSYVWLSGLLDCVVINVFIWLILSCGSVILSVCVVFDFMMLIRI